MPRIPRWLIISIITIAFLGFCDAMYLTAEHYLNAIPPCFIVQGCDTVTTSVYSKIFGIPVSLLGTLYYLTVLVLGLAYVDLKKTWSLKMLHLVTTVGFIMTMWFLYAQAFIIHAWCMYCLFSALSSTTLFVLGALAFHKKWGASVEPSV
jgi:uncharacterized membrane protein